MNIDNLLRQHKEIYAILNSIKEMICRNDFQDNYTEFARSISHLAGKLQIHLNTEDKFLYPKLLENKALEYKTRKYIDEISILLVTFNEFKNKFNTKSKLVNYEYSVIKDETLAIIRKIEERMEREEGDIYELC